MNFYSEWGFGYEKGTKYKPDNKNSMFSSKNSLQNRYYYINNIKIEDPNDILKKEYICIQLIETIRKDTLYFRHSVKREAYDLQIFLTVGLFEKMRKIFMGEDFFYPGKKGFYGSPKNISNGAELTSIPKDTKCFYRFAIKGIAPYCNIVKFKHTKHI